MGSTHPIDPPVPSALGAVQVVLELAVRAPLINLSGHRLDVRFGLWRQAVERTKIHGAVVEKKLWPQQHAQCAPKTSPHNAPSTAAAAAARPALWHHVSPPYHP